MPLYLAFMSGLSAHTGDSWVRPGDLDAFGPGLDEVPIVTAQTGRLAMETNDRDTAAACARRLRIMLPRLPADGRRPYIVVTTGEIAA